LSPLASLPSNELIKMVITLASVKTSMPRKHRSIIKKEYGLNVEANKVMGDLHYTAGGSRLMPDLRFNLKAGSVMVRSYKPGDWEIALKSAYDDLVSQSGVFGKLSIKFPEPTKELTRSSKTTRTKKKKGLFERLTGMFIEPED